MSIDPVIFEKAARRALRQGLRDLLPPTTSGAWYLDDATDDLAHSLAVVAEVRISDLRTDLLEGYLDEARP